MQQYKTCPANWRLEFSMTCPVDCMLMCVDTADGSLWDLGVLDWIQVRAECVRFCMGRSASPAALLPVSSDIEYEFGTRNPYNYLQVTYYKVKSVIIIYEIRPIIIRYVNHNTWKGLSNPALAFCFVSLSSLPPLYSWIKWTKQLQLLTRSLWPIRVTWR